jgi:hypothetical protein
MHQFHVRVNLLATVHFKFKYVVQLFLHELLERNYESGKATESW